MKKILLFLAFIVSTLSFAQTNGITYQAVIYSINGESVPGINNSNAPLANKNICLQFSIVDDFSQTEYQEKVTVTTDDYGMVNLIIGTGTQTGGYANSFETIVWNSTKKYLKVSLDQSGKCNSFDEISNQVLSYVPFAFAANSTTSVSGIVGIANGGTNATTITGAKTNLQLQNVDNTRDLDKPIATLTQTALNSKVDKVSGKELSSNDYSTAEKTKLAAISGVNTGDQDLSSYATTTSTTTALALKVDKVSGKELSSNDFSTAEKTKLAAISGVNTGDQDLNSYATTISTTTALALKVDKVVGKNLSTEDFTTAEKIKLASLGGTLDLSPYAVKFSPVFSGVPTSPTASVGTNSTQIATTAFVNSAVIASTNGNFVDLTNNQTVSGNKAFNNNLTINSILVGKGSGIQSTLFGNAANAAKDNTTAIGFMSLNGNSGISNTSVGTNAMRNSGITSMNTAIGEGAGTGVTTGSGNTFLGHSANVTNNSAIENATSIGFQALVTSSNTIQLGNSNISNVKTSGKLTIGAITLPNTDGISGQVLTTNGAGVLTWINPVTMSDLVTLQNQITSLNNSVNNLQSQISQLQNSGSWSPTVISGSMSDIFANYFVLNNVVYVSGNFSNADFDGMGMYVDLNIPVSANFINASDVHGTVLGKISFGESASGFVEAIPNTSTVRLNVAGAHMWAGGTNGSFVFSYKLPGASSSSSYTPTVSSGTGTFSDTNYIVNGNIVLVNGNFEHANLDDYGAFIEISLPISTNFINSSDASGIISGITWNESLSGYIEALSGTNKVRLRASGAHGMGFDATGSFVFSYKINATNNVATYSPTVLSGTGSFSNANYFTVGNVVYVSGNFSNTDFDGSGMNIDISIPGSTIFTNASNVIGSVSGIGMGESVSGFIKAIPNTNTVRLTAVGAHRRAFGTDGSFIFSYINQ